jgi:hypothetical protein
MGMAEIGQISRGTVIRILPYGALVRLMMGLWVWCIFPKSTIILSTMSPIMSHPMRASL